MSFTSEDNNLHHSGLANSSYFGFSLPFWLASIRRISCHNASSICLSGVVFMAWITTVCVQDNRLGTMVHWLAVMSCTTHYDSLHQFLVAITLVDRTRCVGLERHRAQRKSDLSRPGGGAICDPVMISQIIWSLPNSVDPIQILCRHLGVYVTNLTDGKQERNKHFLFFPFRLIHQAH